MLESDVDWVWDEPNRLEKSTDDIGLPPYISIVLPCTLALYIGI
jgi:hypothetical protein